MIHAARALGLRVMLGCMVESQLGVAPAAAIASLADWVDLDGHLLLADQPFAGLRFEDGRVLPERREPGLGSGAGMSERLAIFAEGLFAKHTGKTAHGVIRYGTREVVAVIDSTCAGRTASEVEPFCLKPVPIVATLERGARARRRHAADRRGAARRKARSRLAADAARGARGRRCRSRPGLHTQLNEDPELARPPSATARSCATCAQAPPDLTVPQGPYSRPDSVQVVHSVGSDTVIGKKVVTLELDRAARERGLRSVYVPTGQTGVAIAGWGIAVDHVISDYVAGAGERLVHEGAERGDLLFVEGQGAIFHPAYSGVTLGLLHGSAPDLLVLVHKAGATHNRNYPDLPIPPLNELIAAYERVAAPRAPRPRGRDRAQHVRPRRGRRPRGDRRGRARNRPRGRRRGPLRPRARAGRRAAGPGQPRPKARPDIST